ncbi:MAG: AAA family ATPase [Bacteroidetes bacterium]|nr:AAA family ATPase [Bacteroidota bacterium]
MSRIKDHKIRKFNPGAFQSDEEVIKQFVVRNHELQTVLDILHDNIETPSCQHTLIVGPRGQGKTMLLARTAAELRSNEQFSEYLLPVRFMEESQEIFNMADFWLETLFHLARECQQFGSQLGQELNIRHSVLSKKWGSDLLEDLARNAVLDVADQLDRKLVLMIENLQELFKDVDENFGWKLRKILQTEPQIILVGSATSRFEGLDDAKLPFFEFFWIIHLEPLNTVECQQLWTMISGQDMSGREIRPLEILTGGSPRLLVIVASFAQHKSTHQLMEELVLLVDEHTDYFRGNLEVLAKTERRVFLAIIDLWQPSTPTEISIRARMDIRKVSTMLGRLVKRGAVIVEGSGRKRKYAAAERLYSIYYKLRRNRDESAVVQNLIRFMSVFYTEAEQTVMFSALVEEMAESEAIQEAFNRTMAEDPESAKKLVIIVAANVLRKISSREDRRLREVIVTSFNKGDFAKVIQAVDQVLSSDASQLPESTIAWALLMKAAAYQKQGNLEPALSTANEIINRWSSAENPELQHSVAGALIIKGETLLAQGKVEFALLTVEEVVKDFGSKEAPHLQACVACALTIKGEILQNQRNQNSAVEAFEEAVRRLDAVNNHEFHWCIARALTNKGKLLSIQGQLESALSTLEEVIERFGSSKDIELQLWVGRALINKGELLHVQSHLETALSIFENVVKRIGITEDSELKSLAVRALIKKAEILKEQGHQELALSALEDVIERFNITENPEQQLLVARALINQGEILQAQGQAKPALSAFEGVIERFSIAGTSDLQVMVSFALLHKIRAQYMANESTPDAVFPAVEEGIEFTDAIAHTELSDSMRLPLQKNLAAMLTLKGAVLHAQGKMGLAKTAFEEVIERFGNAENQELQTLSTRALISKAELQINEGNIQDALFTYNEIIQRLSEVNGHEEIRLTWDALRGRTKALLIWGDLPAAADSFRSLYVILDPNSEAMIRIIANLVINLVAAGMAPHTLLKILSSNDVREDALRPVIVALRQEAGEKVRAPEEILEVISDIRKDIQEQRSSLDQRGENKVITVPQQVVSHSAVIAKPRLNHAHREMHPEYMPKRFRQSV